MSTPDAAAFAVALAVMLAGLVGAILPGLPGTPLIVAAAAGHRLVRGDAGPSWWVVAVLAAVALASIGLDIAASAVGARKLGATWRGALGAAIGAVLGIFWMPLGLLLGPLAGAILLEMLAGRDWRGAGKAGLGAVLGLLAGAVGKVACALGMIGLYVGHMLVRWIAQANP